MPILLDLGICHGMTRRVDSGTYTYPTQNNKEIGVHPLLLWRRYHCRDRLKRTINVEGELPSEGESYLLLPRSIYSYSYLLRTAKSRPNPNSNTFLNRNSAERFFLQKSQPKRENSQRGGDFSTKK